jgi:hypothetical protein
VDGSYKASVIETVYRTALECGNSQSLSEGRYADEEHKRTECLVGIREEYSRFEQKSRDELIGYGVEEHNEPGPLMEVYLRRLRSEDLIGWVEGENPRREQKAWYPVERTTNVQVPSRQSWTKRI